MHKGESGRLAEVLAEPAGREQTDGVALEEQEELRCHQLMVYPEQVSLLQTEEVWVE